MINGRHRIAYRIWLAAALLTVGVLVSTAAAAAPAPDAPPVRPDPPPASTLRPDAPPSSSPTPSRSPAPTFRPHLFRRSPTPAPAPRPTTPKPATSAGDIPPPGGFTGPTSETARRQLARANLNRERATTSAGGVASSLVLSLALVLAGVLAVLGVVAFGRRGVYRDSGPGDADLVGVRAYRDREPGTDADLVGVGAARDQVPDLLP